MRYNSYSSEAVLKALARRLGRDEERWGLAGLLHDVDVEITGGDPKTHALRAAEMLREKGIIKAGCNFCNQFYQFDRIDIEKILSEKLLPKCRKSPINTGPLPIYPCRPLSGLYQRKRLTRKPRFFNKLTKPSSPSK